MKNKEHETIIIKENSITLAKGAITMATNEKVKILSKKWGKPKKEVYEGSPLYDGLDGYTTYIWKKGKTTITYVSPVDETFCGLRKRIDIHSSDKNIKIFGIKVGMERKRLRKSRKNSETMLHIMGVRTKKLIIYIVVSTWNSSIAHLHTTTKTVSCGKIQPGERC